MMKGKQFIFLCTIAFITLGFTLLSGCSKSVKENSSGPAANSGNYSSSAVSAFSAISHSSQQAQAQSSTASSARMVSIPAFNGTVSNDKLPLIDVSDDEWEQAKQDFISQSPEVKNDMKSVKYSDFVLSDNWHGILNNEPFKLNVFSLQAQFLLVVSEYGNNPAQIKLFIRAPRCVFAFYGDGVYLYQQVKGIGEPFNMITDQFEGQTDELNIEFGQLFQKLSAIEPAKRPVGAKIQIDGYNLLILRDMHIVVIDK